MKCPGQDTKYWKDDAIFEVDCPQCGNPVEFYKDDTSRKCAQCSHRFVNPKMDFGCASYCQFAEQCLGTLPEDFAGPQDTLIKDKVAVEVKRYHHTDFSSIRKATNAAMHAEAIGKKSGGNLVVILCATYLQGIDSIDIKTILAKVGAQHMFEQIQSLITDQTEEERSKSSLESQIIHDALIISEIQKDLKRQTVKRETAILALDQNLLLSTSKEHAKSTLF